jgi:multiple sugar transport system permease protein
MMSQTTPAPPVTDVPIAKKVEAAGRKSGRTGSSPWYYVGIAVIVVYCLAPFYWMVVSALRRPADQFSNAPIPNPLSFKNLGAAFSPGNGFARGLLNSVIVAGTTTIITLLIGITAAYALARLNFRGKGLALSLIIATSMVPGIAVVVPMLQLFTDIHWINTYQAMIVPSLSFGLPLAIWLLTAFFKQMPFELEEAAQIDGCSPAQAFRKVILPLAAPGVFTTAILVFIFPWNDFLFANTLTSTSSARTVPATLAFFTGGSHFQDPTGQIAAAAVVVTVPIIIMVLIFQRRIVAGLTAGAVKG